MAPTTKLSSFPSLAELRKSLIRDGMLSGLPGRGAALPPKSVDLLLAPVVAVAQLISDCAPELLTKSNIRIAVVSASEHGGERLYNSTAFLLLPLLLNLPDADVAVSVVCTDGKGSDYEKGQVLPFALDPVPGSARVAQHHIPLHGYLENRPDGPLDLVILLDVDVQFDAMGDWVEELAHIAAEGATIASIAGNADEAQMYLGLLGLYGIDLKGSVHENRFDVSTLGALTWGKSLFALEATARLTSQPPGEAVSQEIEALRAFVAFSHNQLGRYPELRTFGRVLSGPESPAANGSPIVHVADSLYFDQDNERLYQHTGGALVSVKPLDDYARRSALLATYDGRSGRFEQILWGVRVLMEVMQEWSDLMAPAGLHDGDDDPRVCESCGAVHTASERVAAIKGLLSEALDDESPRARLKAVLEMALELVDDSGLTGDFDVDEEDDDDDDAMELYEKLLRRGHLHAALKMALDDEDGERLLVEGWDEDGWPLACLAMLREEWDVLEEMAEISEGCDAAHSDGESVFHAMARIDTRVPEHIMMMLVDQCSLNSPDDYGIYPLELAVDAGNSAVIAQMLDAGADITSTGIDPQKLAGKLRAEGFVEQADRLTPKKKRTASAKGKTPVKTPARKRAPKPVTPAA